MTSSDTRGPQLLVAIWLLTSISALFLGLRLYCKFWKVRNLWLDDYLLTLGWLTLLFDSIFVTIAVSLGYGHHALDLDPSLIVPILKWIKVGGTLSIIGAILTKCSFALMLLRLTHGWMRALLVFAIASITLFMGGAAIVLNVYCTPLTKVYDPTIPGVCWPESLVIGLSVFASAYSAAFDIILALLPWVLLWNLQMKIQEKIGVAIAMSLGIFAGITAAVKTPYIISIMKDDYSFDGYSLEVWSAAETAVTVIAASIPILRMLITQFARTHLSKERRSAYKMGDTKHTTVKSESRDRLFRQDVNSSDKTLKEGGIKRAADITISTMDNQSTSRDEEGAGWV